VKEMSDQVRGILFVILSLVILFAFGHFYKPPVPPPQPNPTQTSAPARQADTQQSAAQGGAAANPAGGANSSVKAAVPANSSVVEAGDEKIVVVQSPLSHVELSNRGGVVKTWELKKYFDDQKPPHPLDLVNDSVAKELGWPFSLVLADPQLEAKANSALYQVKAVVVVASEKNGTVSNAAAITDAAKLAASTSAGWLDAPVNIIFHWSDGHLDVTKTLSFTEDYQTTVDVSVLLDGKPEPVAVAWRGGFGDKAVYNAAQLVTVYYKTGGKLNLLQYKKLGVSGNQSQPAVQNGPLEFAGIEDQFFTAAFLPDGTDLSLWHWMQNHAVTVDGKQSTEPEAEMGTGTAAPAPLHMRVYVGPKDSTATGGAGEFWMDGNHRQAAFVDSADLAHKNAQLGMVHRDDDASHQLGDVSAEDEKLALDAEDAKGGAGNPADSGSLQEIFDERSTQEKNE
jgi:YidC/Oxa1 family membrane protein insertase